MAGNIIGTVTVPCVGGRVVISSIGRIAIQPDLGEPVMVDVDDVTAIQIAEAILAIVVPMMTSKRPTDPPPAEPSGWTAPSDFAAHLCGGCSAEAGQRHADDCPELEHPDDRVGF